MLQRCHATLLTGRCCQRPFRFPCPRLLLSRYEREPDRTAGRSRLLRSKLFLSPVNERSVLAPPVV